MTGLPALTVWVGFAGGNSFDRSYDAPYVPDRAWYASAKAAAAELVRDGVDDWTFDDGDRLLVVANGQPPVAFTVRARLEVS